MRVGIISLIHESNTFLSTPTTMAMFRDAYMLTGQPMYDRFEGGFHEISGFLEVLELADVEAVPLLYASTVPSGRITKKTCDELVGLIIEKLDGAGELHGLLVAPHGANSGEGDNYRDLDGFWLTRVRERVGPDVPIISTIDPHANLSPRMIDACDATIAYRTNPHLDQLDCGRLAAKLLLQTLRGEIKPVQAAAFPPVAINIERQATSEEPCLSLYRLADEILNQDGVLSDSIVLGFPYADTEEMGSACIAVTDDDPLLARREADHLAVHLIERRTEFAGEFIAIEEAIDEALASPGPVCLLDMGDNAGGGSAADGTVIAHALAERRLRGFVCLFDPESARMAKDAGIGVRLRMAMGGKTDDMHGSPLVAEVTVRALTDGRFTESEVRHGGRTEYDMGPTAVVETDSGLTVSLTSKREMPVSLGVITSCGLDPADFQIIVAKGVHSPVAAYTPVCPTLIRVDTPGATAADMRRFTYHYRRQPLYPLEEISDYI